MKRRPDGRWQKIKTINGKKVAFYSTADTEKKAIKDIENQMLAYSQKEEYNKHNFKALADQMIEHQSENITYNTLQSYTYSLKYLEPLFDYNIEEIKPSKVQALIDDMVNKKKYSFSAVSKAKIVFGLVMDYAIVHEELPINNFSKSIKVPKNASKGKVSSPPKEVTSLIIENADKVEFGMWPFVFLCTGLRRGEQAALKRKNINFEKNEIYIDDAVEFIVNQPNLKGKPKSDASIDTVPILDILKPKLQELCKDLEPEEFVFGKTKPLTKTQIDKGLKKYCKTIGYSFTGHQLRHAYAKLLYKAGVDVKTMQRLLRHADFKTTMNIYTEFSNEVTNNSVTKINEYFTQL